MKKIKNLICIFAAGGLLVACSYFETGEGVDISSDQPPAETINLTAQDGSVIQPLAPIEYRDVAKVIHESSNGRVQIFSLDGEDFEESDEDGFSNSSDNVVVEPVSAVPLYDENYLNGYPGVEVYPLDDAMAELVNPRLVRPMAPAPTSGPMLLTPFPVSENNAGTRNDFVVMDVGGGGAVVYFDHDTVMLNPENSSLVNGLAKAYGGQEISVAGHASVQSSVTDPIQRQIINLKISMDRAFAVARALIEGGVPAERIETKAYGEVRPPVPGHKPIEIASRRVEISGVSVQ